MTIEAHGALTSALIVIGIALAALAVRGFFPWLLGVSAVALTTSGTVSWMILLRRTFAMTHPPIDQREPEEVADNSDVPGLGCGERRRVDTDGRTTRTTLDSQP